MISSPSIIGRVERRDIARDRQAQIRDRILCAIEDAGRPLSPAVIARHTGLGQSAVVRATHRWPAYFAWDTTGAKDGKPRTTLIDRHHHLKTGV
jgi:hypothetical protein